MQLDDLRDHLARLGAKSAHMRRVLRAWCGTQALTAGRQRPEDCLPRPLLTAWPALSAELAGLARLQSRHPGADASERLLVQLADGQTVESVLLPREGLCVSTQVGCAVGCTFCMTGRDGLIRQLTSGEIVAQVALARTLRPVKKVVFMGMGEPAHNLDAVCAAIELLGNEGGIGHKNLVLSTVGDPRVFTRLPQMSVRPALAISLHSTRRQQRAALLPRAADLTPEELVAAGEAWARATGYPIQYQWTLLAGINDGDDELDGIVRLLAGKLAMMNFIPVNALPDSPYRRPERERLFAMIRHLRTHGIIATIRDSAGQDVDGGCGQLRARERRERQRKAPGV